MGNLQSSSSSNCFPTINLSRPKQTATLFDAKGELLRRVNLPLKAAELMLEEDPGHVISPVEDLRRTGRYSAMKADDELSPRQCYVLVPLSKLNRRASEADVAAVLESALKSRKSTSKRHKKRSKVSPTTTTTLGEDSKVEEEKDESEIRVLDISVGVTDLGFMCRQRGYSRGWKPNLDTIAERISSTC